MTDADRWQAATEAWAQLQRWLMTQADTAQPITAAQVLDRMAELDNVRKLGQRSPSDRL